MTRPRWPLLLIAVLTTAGAIILFWPHHERWTHYAQSNRLVPFSISTSSLDGKLIRIELKIPEGWELSSDFGLPGGDLRAYLFYPRFYHPWWQVTWQGERSRGNNDSLLVMNMRRAWKWGMAAEAFLGTNCLVSQTLLTRSGGRRAYAAPASGSRGNALDIV